MAIESEGLDGYTVEPAQKDSYHGTVITLYPEGQY